jgi:hypothetical protein
MKTPQSRKPYRTPTYTRETLAQVKREMARPHRAESTKKNADSLANGGHLAKG